MKEQYTKKELRKYLSSALKELRAYSRFAISFEIYDAKLSDPEYATGGKYGAGYSWRPYFKEHELKSLEYGHDVGGMCQFHAKKDMMEWMVEGVILEIQSYEAYGQGIVDYFYIELPTKSNPNKELVKYKE